MIGKWGKSPWVVSSLLTSVIVVLTACSSTTATPTAGSSAAPAATTGAAAVVPGSAGKLVFCDITGDAQWETQTRVVGFIAENGYGYKPEYLAASVEAIVAGMRKGDIDFCATSGNWNDTLDPAVKAGELVILGKIQDTPWQSGFVVPKYVLDANPGLKSVTDLPKFQNLFATAETGGKIRYVNCPAAWACNKTNAAKLKGYGLESIVSEIVPGAGAALDADLLGAAQKKQPWLGFAFGPSAPAAKVELVPLQEPAYSDQCWSTTKACAYPIVDNSWGANKKSADKAPKIAEFLKKALTKGDEVSQIVVQVDENKMKAEDAAVWYLKNYKQTWTTWVPADVATLVNAALDKKK